MSSTALLMNSLVNLLVNVLEFLRFRLPQSGVPDHWMLDNRVVRRRFPPLVRVLIDERDWSLVAAGVKTDDDDGELWYAMIHNRERASSNIHMHPTFFAGRVYMPCTTLSHPNSMRIRVRRIDLKTINGPGVLAAVRRVFTA